MSRTSIAKALRKVATADTVGIVVEIAAETAVGAEDVLAAVDVDVVAAADAEAVVVDVTAVAMAVTAAADDTKVFRHGSARIFRDNQN
jgi:hypothetical protein